MCCDSFSGYFRLFSSSVWLITQWLWSWFKWRRFLLHCKSSKTGVVMQYYFCLVTSLLSMRTVLKSVFNCLVSFSLCYRVTIDIMPYQFCAKCRNYLTMTLRTVSTVYHSFKPLKQAILKTSHLQCILGSALGDKVCNIHVIDWSFKHIFSYMYYQVYFFMKFCQVPMASCHLKQSFHKTPTPSQLTPYRPPCPHGPCFKFVNKLSSPEFPRCRMCCRFPTCFSFDCKCGFHLQKIESRVSVVFAPIRKFSNESYEEMLAKDVFAHGWQAHCTCTSTGSQTSD